MSKVELKSVDEQQAEARAKFSPKPGTKRLMVVLSDEHYAIVEKLALEDDREIGAYLSRWLRQALSINQAVAQENQKCEAQINASVVHLGKAN